MKKPLLFTAALSTHLLAGVAIAAPGWNVSKYVSPDTQIFNYATADALIAGSGLAYSDSSSYLTSNTQDDNHASGPFGLGTQVAGLPSGNNDDFAFQASASFTVNTGGTYVFGNNTDDGSRLRLSINGNPSSTIIADDVLSPAHTVSSAGIALNAGDTINLDWMWFERGGGAAGESFYSRDGGALALWENGSQGLTLDGGAYTGTVYKSNALVGPYNLAQADAFVTSGTLLGSGTFPTINFGTGGRIAGESPIPGGAGDLFVLNASSYITLAAGQYTFFTNTDDGARLRIDGVDVVVDGFPQPETDSAYVTVTLSAGEHRLDYTGFEIYGGETFELWMAQGDYSAAKYQGVFGPQFHLVGDSAFPVSSTPSTIPESTSSGALALGLFAFLSRRRRA